MTWEQISYNIEQFWNKPIPIICFIAVMLIIIFLIIFSKTSFGKKALNELKLKFDVMKNMFDEIIKAKDEIINRKEEIIAEMKQDYEDKLALIQAEKDKEKEVIIAIAQNINNIKIKKIIEEYKHTVSPESISELVEEVKKDYESKYEQVLKELEELKNGKNSDSIEEEISQDTI